MAERKSNDSNIDILTQKLIERNNGLLSIDELRKHVAEIFIRGYDQALEDIEAKKFHDILRKVNE